MKTDWNKNYPARYYAAYDTSAAQPTPITAWYDMALYGSLDGFPPASEMIALTADQWEKLSRIGYGVQNGNLVPYTPPIPVVPLKTQAQTAQAWINQQYAQSFAMGTPFTADMRAYVKAIAAIANGTDTTSTALPAQPADVMEATA